MIFDPDIDCDGERAREFLAEAAQFAQRSLDPSTKVGAVVADADGMISAGFNHLLDEIEPTPEIYADRPLKYDFTVHAEFNAILGALEMGIPVRGSAMFMESAPGGLLPCKECAKFMARVGIAELHCRRPAPGTDFERWRESNAAAIRIFERAKVRVCEWD